MLSLIVMKIYNNSSILTIIVFTLTKQIYTSEILNISTNVQLRHIEIVIKSMLQY